MALFLFLFLIFGIPTLAVLIPLKVFFYAKSINEDKPNTHVRRVWVIFSLVYCPAILLIMHQFFFNNKGELWEEEMENAFGASNISWPGVLLLPSCIICWKFIIKELQKPVVSKSFKMKLAYFTLAAIYIWYALTSYSWGLFPFWHLIVLSYFYFSLPKEITNEVLSDQDKKYTFTWIFGHVVLFISKAWAGFYVIDEIPQRAHTSCFVTGAASRGHRLLVGSVIINNRIINHQVINFKKFEYILQNYYPKFHALFRKYYNHFGKRIAYKINNKIIADIVFIALLPLEFCVNIFNRFYPEVSFKKQLIKYMR